jgi:zinc transporter, ZIP family
MASSFGWGLLASSSLLIGGAIAVRWKIGPRILGSVMAFGSGVLISAVAFDLVEEAYDSSHAGKTVTLGLLAGCAVFFAGDLAIDHFGGASARTQAARRRAAQVLRSSLGRCSTGSRNRLSSG